MPHTFSTGPSRKACSAAVRACGLKSRRRFQFGLPLKNSASHQTVPASMATFSVSLMRGRIGVTSAMTLPESSARRRPGTPVTTAIRPNSPATTKNVVVFVGDCIHQPTSSVARGATQPSQPLPK